MAILTVPLKISAVPTLMTTCEAPTVSIRWSGADSFAFGRNDGDDTISSFQNGIDVIDFSGINIAFGNLNITDDGTDTTVDYGTGSITILGTLQSQIDQDDFIFA